MAAYQVFLCPQCKRKRRIVQTRGARFHHWRCSQGHTWDTEVGPLEKINEATMQAIMPGLMDRFFTDDAFLTCLKRH